MKRIIPALLIPVLWTVFITCSSVSNSDKEETPSEAEGLTITGLPSETVKANATFTLKASSPSKGQIDFRSSNPAQASVVVAGIREYHVSVGAPSVETPVTITFIQDAKGNYPEYRADVKFTVLPESHESTPTVPNDPHAELDGIKVAFQEAKEMVVNPERGFYTPLDFQSSSSALNAHKVTAERLEGRTLWYLGFYLTDFMEGDISQAYLDKIQQSFNALRDGGAKCILRFAYKDHHSDGEVMDPEVDIVMRHVEQLKPLLQKNEDVIFVLQAGFVGAWGEWYYTTHFGFQPKKDSDYAPRKKLTDALLDALPESRQIELRTPQFKMRMYGLSVKDTVTALTAHDGSFKSRLAGHNDCFGASQDDYGTFDNETMDRDFWEGDTRYLIMGGETCGVSEYCTCEASIQDMIDYHWTYLNIAYHTGVHKGWKNGGCFNNIVDRLGYRLVMQDLYYDAAPEAGKTCKVTLRFYNTGFAAPMNPRNAFLVWVTPSGNKEQFMLGSDPRTWHPGYHTVQSSFTPTSAKGSLYLLLSDPLLPDDPHYSIVLANEDVFDSKTGMNKLFEIK